MCDNLTAMTGQQMDRDAGLSARFSAEVRAELARTRTSATTLATLLGVSPATIYRRLNGDSEWPLDDAMTLALHLGVPLTRLTSESAA